MRLGSEVDDDLDLLFRRYALDELEVADVAFDEPDIKPIEVASVACIREQVERQGVVLRMALEPLANEVGADDGGPCP